MSTRRPSPPTRRRRPSPRRRAARRVRRGLALGVLAAGGLALAVHLASAPSPVTPFCSVPDPGSPSSVYTLDPGQAANATTIAAVGRRVGLPDHAVTVALAAALQESKLRDLTYGDRDSVGLFQQRPSQGWGSRTELLDPVYAATAFYQRLAQVPGWQTLAVTVAAQAVQHSAAPDAYASWAPEAQAWAIALTGEEPAGVSCVVAPPSGPPSPSASVSMARGAAAVFGADPFGRPVAPADGWTAAAWAVAHAARYGVDSVAYQDRRWTAATGRWGTDPSAGQAVDVTFRR